MADVLPPPSVAGGTTFAPHSAGVHPMLCVDVIDLGLKPDSYQNGPIKLKHFIALVFASGEAREDGELVTIQREFNYSMHENASLRAFVESWRGKPYASDDEAAKLQLAAMEGAAALVNVAHVEGKNGRTYGNITSVSPLVKGMPKPVVTGYVRGEWWAKKKAEYATLAAPYLGKPKAPADAFDDFVSDPEDDDLPFSVER